MNIDRFQDAQSADRRIEQYLRAKADREIAALLLQDVLPDLSDLGPAAMIIESAIDRLLRSDGGSLNGPEAQSRADRLALEESDASSELFQFTF
jgi:hypothetical protein